jgi:glutamine amidotransferase
MEVSIIDSETCNLFSIKNALENIGAKTKVVSSHRDLNKANALVLPGVGSYKEAMKNLKKKKLINPILRHITTGKRFLGICLGFQLLFESSEEFGNTLGLGVLKGKIKSFEKKKISPVPHVGWNIATFKKKNCFLKKRELFYFVHSFYVEPKDKKIIYSKTKVDGFNFCSSIVYKNIFGCQFHPEKSGKIGLQFLKKFMEIKC